MNPMSHVTRFFARKTGRRLPIRKPMRLRLEVLEDRVVPTVAGDFVVLQQELQTFLSKVDGALDTVVEVSQAKLPIIDKSLGEITGADTAIDSFKDTVDGLLGDIGDAVNEANLEQYAEDLLNQYLGSGPQGIDIQLSPAEVTLPRSANDDVINVKLHLGKVVASPDFTFGLGLSSVPFKVTTQGTFNFDVGFEIPTLEFGLDKNAGFFIRPFAVQLAANANLVNPELDAELGFLHVHVSENPENLNGNHLSASFGITVDPSNPNTPVVSKPMLNGTADVDLLINGAITDAEVQAPNVDANFVLHWDFINSQTDKTDSSFGSNLTAVFKDVRINLGTYLEGMVGPAVQKIQQYTEPFKDFFQLMGEPIPVVSDIAKVVGDNDGVSLLDIAGVVADSGEVPPDYAALIKLAKAVIQITNVINQIEAEKGAELKNAFIPLGDFDLIGNQGDPNSPDYKDIRDVTPAEDVGFGSNDITKINWSNLRSVAENLDLTAIKNAIHDALGDSEVGQSLGDALSDALDNLKKSAAGGGNSASINLTFPIADHPAAAVFGLLVGQDTDLISFSADAHLDGSANSPVFNYQGFEISLFGGITVDAHIKLAYDTYGLRHVVYDFIHPPAGGVTGESIGLNLLNGFYIDPTTHLNLGGTIGIKGGVNYTLLQAYVSGHLDATIDADLSPTRDEDADGDGVLDPTDQDGDGRIRPFEFHDCLFNISGNLSGGLDFEIKVGVDPLSWSDKINLAEGEIASFDIGCTNPFAPADTLALAAYDENTHQLTLNMGSFARRSARHLKDDPLDEPINEKFIITHSEPQPGDPNFGEAVNVSAFGFTQRYTGVTSIFADGDDGNDSISIDDAVQADVTLLGGAGNDVLKASGPGIAMLDGGGDDDSLTGGIGVHALLGGGGDDILIAGTGNAEIHGGAGDDQIHGGAGINQLFGDAGIDIVTGGAGPNTIFGGDGDDHLIAGPQDGDTLHGDGGNDFIEAGQGFDNLFGDAGDDQFVWYFVDAVLEQADGKPAQGVAQSDGPARINGGTGNNQATFFGGPGADAFTLSKTVGIPGFEAQLLVPVAGEAAFFGFASILLTQVEDVGIEAGQGADQITIHDLIGTRIRNVGVNLTDLVENHFSIDDGAIDHVTVNATQNDDLFTIKAENLIIQEPTPPDTKDGIAGGVTNISGNDYVVRVGNVEDDLVFNALDGNDTLAIKGITGPTLVHGNGNMSPRGGSDDDLFLVSALFTKDYATELNIDADGGVNTMHVSQPGGFADTFELTQERIESNLLHAVNFVATGGDYTGGVTLSTGQAGDTVNVRNTLPGVHTIVETGKGDDSVNVGSLSGNVTGVLGILSVDVGEGSDNTLKITDTAAAIGSQNVAISADQVLGFAGPSNNTPIDFHATGGELTLWLEGSNHGGSIDRFLVNDPHAKLRVNAQDGADEIYVAALSQLALLEGGPGNDTMILGYGFKQLGPIQAGIIAFGGDGFDILNAVDTLAAPGQTYVLGANLLSRSGAGPVWFDGSLELLNIDTTDFDDQVLVQATPVANTVNINAHLGNDRLTGPNADTNWLVLGANQGKLGNNVLFAGAENLRGGTANDRFTLSDGKGVAGTIQGGGGTNDVLDFSQYTVPVEFNVETNGATQIGGWSEIDRFVGGAAANLLIAPNLPNFWGIQGANSGQLGTLAKGPFQFQSVENLQGGSSTDVFQFAPAGQVAGSVNGQAGIDTLDYSQFPGSMPVRVNMILKTATGVGAINAIENAAGGAGSDVLVGDAAANQLFGNAGRDLLIGGLGIDTLNGGQGDDILIAGQTSFDTDASGKAFAAIMKEWNSHQPYAVRRAHLAGKQMGGVNGVFKLNQQTVKLDVAKDKLTGGAGLDWFWANANEILDLKVALGEKIGLA